METESEPYVRLATLRQLHQAVADLNTARSLADTLQTVADGIVDGLGYELGCVNLVRPDGDLVVAAFAGNTAAEALITGRVGSRDVLGAPALDGRGLGRAPVHPAHRGLGPPRRRRPAVAHRGTRAPLRGRVAPPGPPLRPHVRLRRPVGNSSGSSPSTGRATAAVPAPGAARPSRCTPPRPPLRSVTPGSEQTCSAPWSGWSASSRRCGPARNPSARPSSTRPAAWPSPRWAATSTAGCCGPTTRSAGCWAAPPPSCAATPSPTSSTPRTSAPCCAPPPRAGGPSCGSARRDGTYLWVSLRNSVVADTTDGPRFLLTHVEDIEERKRNELNLAHRASHDSLTGLPNSAELRSRLGARLCAQAALRSPPRAIEALDAAYGDVGRPRRTGTAPTATRGEVGPGVGPYDHHVHTVAPDADARRRHQGARGALLRPRRLQVHQRPLRAPRG